MTEFNELLVKRRSIRQFEERAVPHELVMEIIRESLLAPSASNGQPWLWSVIHDRELITRLSSESKSNILADLDADPKHPGSRYRGVVSNPDFNVFYNAPCLVIISGPNNRRGTFVDCSLAACYFMLGAADKGLGTCWVDLGANIRSPELRAEIGLAEEHVVIAPIALGYPGKIPRPPQREEPKILRVIA